MTGASDNREYANPQQVCDIVMKGGITSGVVYPGALVALAKKFRLSSIGGTSAGAIAAGAAAAAEYGRYSAQGGFARLAAVPGEIGPDLLGLFQPTPPLKPLFGMLVGALQAKSKFGKVIGALRGAVAGYWGSALLGAGSGFVIAALLCAVTQEIAGIFVFGLIFALIGLIIAVLWRVAVALTQELPNSDYGLCTGLTQPGAEKDAFTDWLAKLIEETAGPRAHAGAPLTFGDLLTPPDGRPTIQLAMMTTSLMERRPYKLPMEKNRVFVFQKEEWSKLFPESVLTYLTNVCDPFHPTEGEEGTFFHFPDQAHLPVIVAARMSLSFPGLIAAVPLWRKDYTFSSRNEQHRLRRCLFSDGGLSSNFPIHFFDHLLPNSPTFAISLDEFDEKRSRNGGRVWLPSTAEGGEQIPVEPFDGIGGFLLRLVDSAKDWQDHLQSILPGYRERIVHIGLKPDEGGLNLTMDEDKIEKLSGFGEAAGKKLCNSFDLDAHRWRRFLVAMARAEETLVEVADAYQGTASIEGFEHFLERYSEHPSEYKQSETALAELLALGQELAKLGAKERDETKVKGWHIPKPATNLRISPKQ